MDVADQANPQPNPTLTLTWMFPIIIWLTVPYRVEEHARSLQKIIFKVVYAKLENRKLRNETVQCAL